MPIRAITFDVGGTLIEPWPSVGHVYAGVAAQFGVDGVAPDQLTENFVRAWKARSGFDYSRASWFALVRETFGDRAARLPAEFFSAVYDRFAAADTWRLYDDVLPALAALAQRGVKLGVISNWDDRLRPLLAALNLTRFFASIVVSCELGVTKPDPRLFRQAAAELGVAPGELLHVGDSAVMDVAGAQGAGAVGCRVRRRAAAAAVHEVRSLTELIDRLGN